MLFEAFPENATPVAEAPVSKGTKPQEEETCTYADYAQRAEGTSYEFIGGNLVMAPSRATDHRRLVGRLFRFRPAACDLRGKNPLYECAGAKEYWVADPVESSIEVY